MRPRAISLQGSDNADIVYSFVGLTQAEEY